MDFSVGSGRLAAAPVLVSRPASGSLVLLLGVTVGRPPAVPPPGVVETNSKLHTCAMHAPSHQLDAQKWQSDALSGCRKLIIQIDAGIFNKSGNQQGGTLLTLSHSIDIQNLCLDIKPRVEGGCSLKAKMQSTQSLQY